MTASRHCKFWLIALAFASCTPAGPGRPVATTAGSVIHGTWTGGGDIAAFLGIPFAAPPVASNRWKEPGPAPRVPELDASRYAPGCMQGPHMVEWYKDLVADFGGDPDTFPVPEFSEDCLYLNLWTPRLEKDAGLPVMVWIHGGAHRGGWSYEPNYLGEPLAQQGVVVVSIAYRLDVFGFFSHPELDVSNFGLLDQVAALRWVRDNVSAFGGDKDNITVFGESAGAASIGFLLASPLAEGLFRRAIHQSAGYELVNFDTRAEYLEQGAALERQVLKPRNQSGIDALREIAAGELLVAAENVFADYRPDIVVDGRTVTEVLRRSLDHDRLQPVDLLIGSNADEWLMYLDESSAERELVSRLEAYKPANREAVLEELGYESTAVRKLDRLVTAHEFVCPSLLLATNLQQKRKNAFVYYFDRVRPGEKSAALGAYHGAEIPYVFDRHDEWLPTADLDREIGRKMMEYWVSFARTGSPNADGLPEWPSFEPSSASTLEIGDTVRSTRHPEATLCEVLADGN